MKRAGTAAVRSRKGAKFANINKRKIHTSNTGRGKKMKNKFIDLDSDFRFFKGNKVNKSKRRRPSVLIYFINDLDF